MTWVTTSDYPMTPTTSDDWPGRSQRSVLSKSRREYKNYKKLGPGNPPGIAGGERGKREEGWKGGREEGGKRGRR